MSHSCRPLVISVLLGCLAVVVGCRAGEDSTGSDPESSPAARQGQDGSESLALTSTAFKNGQAIPKRHTFEGTDVSPPLAWSGVPKGTKQLALICDDPDAPSRKKPGPKPWVHWVIYGLPAELRAMPEGLARDAQLGPPTGARQGKNSWSADNVGYRGPMPPVGSGPHRYYFKLYALDAKLDLATGKADKDGLLAAIKGHVLAEAVLMGTYERKKK